MHSHGPTLVLAASATVNADITPAVISANALADNSRNVIHSHSSVNSIHNTDSGPSNVVHSDNESNVTITRYSPV